MVRSSSYPPRTFRRTSFGPGLFFSNYLFGLGFKPIQDDFQHDFARVSDEADGSVVLADVVSCPFRQCNNQRLSPLGRPFSCSPDLIIDLLKHQ